MSEEKHAPEELTNTTQEEVSKIEEVLTKADKKQKMAVQKQQYNQYVKFVLMNKKRGAKRKNK